MSAALLLALWMAAAPRLLEVRSESIEGRRAVVVVTTAPLGDVSVRRDGREVLLSLAATAPEPITVPTVTAPLEALRIERTPGRVQLRVRVAPEVAYEVRRELERLMLIFGSAAAAPPPASAVPPPAAPAPPPASAVPPPASAELYPRLFPPSASGGEAGRGSPAVAPPASTELYRGLFPLSASGGEAGEGAPVAPPGAPDVPDRPAEERREGLQVGTLTFRPSATLDYVDADVSLLDTPRPARDHYAEARPALAVDVPLRDGSLRLDYQARIREYSSFPQVNGATHLGNASLNYPAGPAVTLRGTGHFARGLLETTEVDPGGEYFFSLGRFTRRLFGAGARFNPGGRIDLDVAGNLDNVTVDRQAAFFDYERRSVSAGLGVEIGPERRTRLVYSFEQVPPSPQRPAAESRIDSISGAVEGEILPLLSGRAAVGYTRRVSPQAPGGQRFRGLTFAADLKRDFGRSAHLVLSANRSTDLSAFEANAFYVTTSVQSVLTAPLPLSFSLTAGGGYHVNRYPTAASALGAPRRDQIVDWLVGLGRSITRWAYVRADYRRDRRDSNLTFFNQSTHAFYAELGLGFFTEASRP